MAVGAVLAVGGLATLPRFMMLLGSTDTILPHASAYARPILFAAPLMMSSLVMNNILRYEGQGQLCHDRPCDGRRAQHRAGPALHLCVFKMGTGGAGLATALSQCISFSILLSMFLRGKTVSQFRITEITRAPRDYLLIFTNGAPSFGRQGLNSIGGMLLNIAAREYGDAAVAGMSIISPHLYVHPVRRHRRGSGAAARGRVQLWCQKVPPGTAGRYFHDLCGVLLCLRAQCGLLV